MDSGRHRQLGRRCVEIILYISTFQIRLVTVDELVCVCRMCEKGDTWRLHSSDIVLALDQERNDAYEIQIEEELIFIRLDAFEIMNWILSHCLLYQQLYR